MRLIGVIDVKDGHAVHARGGRRETYAPVSKAAGTSIDGDPVRLARVYLDTFGIDDIYIADLDAIASNYRFLSGRVAPRPVYAVVKADGYGHGAGPVAARLAREGADRFAVANPDEGVALRRGGIAGEILVLSRSDPEDVARLVAYGLTPALYDPAQAEGFAAAAQRLRVALPVHVELDTGMGRAGFRPEELDFVIALFDRSPGLRIAGTFANLSRADDPALCKGRQLIGTGVRERLRFHPDFKLELGKLARWRFSHCKNADLSANLSENQRKSCPK